MPLKYLASARKLRTPYYLGLAAVLLLALALVVLRYSTPASSQAQFADPTFRTVWERTDGPVAAGSTLRGWVWGPVGMLLSVPLTVIARIVFESSRDLRWIAVLLASEPPGPDEDEE